MESISCTILSRCSSKWLGVARLCSRRLKVLHNTTAGQTTKSARGAKRGGIKKAHLPALVPSLLIQIDPLLPGMPQESMEANQAPANAATSFVSRALACGQAHTHTQRGLESVLSHYGSLPASAENIENHGHMEGTLSC